MPAGVSQKWGENTCGRELNFIRKACTLNWLISRTCSSKLEVHRVETQLKSGGQAHPGTKSSIRPKSRCSKAVENSREILLNKSRNVSVSVTSIRRYRLYARKPITFRNSG